MKRTHAKKAEFPIWRASGDVFQKFEPFLREGRYWHKALPLVSTLFIHIMKLKPNLLLFCYEFIVPLLANLILHVSFI